MADTDYDFQDRMAQGKEIAQDRRNKGLPTGQPAKGWNYTRPHPTGLDRIQWEYDTWRKEWQYSCLASVETALFADDLEEMAKWL